MFHGSIRDIVAVVGGDVINPFRALCRGPGHSARDRSMSVRLDPNAPGGFLVHSYAGDDDLECKRYVEALLGIERGRHDLVAPRQRRPEAQDKGQNDRIKYALDIFNAARADVLGSLVDIYFRSRGLVLPDAVVEGGSLRFSAACPFRGDDGQIYRLPAMLALLTDAVTAEPTGVHRTALKEDGSGKVEIPGFGAPKKMLGRARGSVVRLVGDENVHSGLGVSEGVENGVACMMAGWSPMWACASAAGMAALPVLAGIETLSIFRDSGTAGEKAASACCQRWTDAGIEVHVFAPRLPGDWNDIVQRGAADA